ncbi:uncharacterized protein ANIA_11262 [Aspergillus nidulans FGSC A4]|uniref:Uncharacterized protein n=1 Tax=Emericella nidulans (strain FGSC A4 / ATCC 38163 / CBS 112.46 / NRRL 194 / M139) TaxID=227321 RepID=C8VUY5_EMENI|nr:hypothetical protein [Aspergillus nidulans FGSC A4]CBF90031.1 TPA: hypothetical protein ANIA_11262 [Aspergillus nidulans FGSC A4]
MVLYAVAWQWAPQSIIATIDGLKAVSYPQDGSRECRFGGRCSTKDHLDAAGVAADMRYPKSDAIRRRESSLDIVQSYLGNIEITVTGQP